MSQSTKSKFEVITIFTRFLLFEMRMNMVLTKKTAEGFFVEFNTVA